MELYFCNIVYRDENTGKELKGIASNATIAVFANDLKEAIEKIEQIIINKNNDFAQTKKEAQKKCIKTGENLYSYMYCNYYIEQTSEVKKADYMLFNCREDWSDLKYGSLN